MAYEPPPHRGKQAKGDGGLVIGEPAHHPKSGRQAVSSPQFTQGAAGHMRVEAAPAGVSHLLVPVPAHQLPQQEGGKRAIVRAQVRVAAVWLRRSRAPLHSFMAWMAGILILLSACSSAPSVSQSPSPSARANGDACAVQRQIPPPGNIAANYATALAFAPD